MESLWERSRHAFERILEESRKATERVVESASEAGGAARARLERARLERTLFKRFAELGHRVYERAGAEGGEAGGAVLEDARVKELLQQVRDLEGELEKLSGRAGERGAPPS